MADVSVKNQSSEKSQARGLQRQGGTSLSRPQSMDPFGSWLSPADFFHNPFALMRRMSEEMDRTFGQFFGQTGRGAGSWYPAIEVSENEGQLRVHAELPGLKPEDVKVEIADDVLTIHGEKKSEQEHSEGRAYRSERHYGEFYRQIALPEGVNADQAKAQFRDGILEITVPVPQQVSNRREIPIQSSSATPSKGPGSEGTTRESTAAKADGR